MPTAKKKHRSNPEWIRRHITDPYVKEANKLGYRSRAAFKLIEIDDREHLLQPGAVVVDLGAAPGSWTQVVVERLKGRDRTLGGKIIALDMLPMEPVDGVSFIQGDFREDGVATQLAVALCGAKVDVILSDLAPNLSGIAPADAARNAHLAELVTDFALQHLASDGALVLKAFQGSGYSQIVEGLKRCFKSVVVRKPPASRAESAETYLVARSLRKPGPKA